MPLLYRWESGWNPASFAFASKYVTRLACAWVGSEAVLAGGTENGTIILWNFLTGRSLMYYPGAHTRAVNALALRRVEGKALLLSASTDGFVRIWRLTFGSVAQQLIEIDVGQDVLDATFNDDETVAIATISGIFLAKIDWSATQL